jgi:hypothetical protein
MDANGVIREFANVKRDLVLVALALSVHRGSTNSNCSSSSRAHIASRHKTADANGPRHPKAHGPSLRRLHIPRPMQAGAVRPRRAAAGGGGGRAPSSADEDGWRTCTRRWASDRADAARGALRAADGDPRLIEMAAVLAVGTRGAFRRLPALRRGLSPARDGVALPQSPPFTMPLRE